MLVLRLLWLVLLVGICALHESASAEEELGDDLFTERIAVKNTTDDVISTISDTTLATYNKSIDENLSYDNSGNENNGDDQSVEHTEIETNDYQGLENSDDVTFGDYLGFENVENVTIGDYQGLENSENMTMDYQGFEDSENDTDSNISVKDLLEGNFTDDGLKGIDIIRNWMKGSHESKEIDIKNLPINGNIQHAEIFETTTTEMQNEENYESTPMFKEVQTTSEVTHNDFIKTIGEFESDIDKILEDVDSDIQSSEQINNIEYITTTVTTETTTSKLSVTEETNDINKTDENTDIDNIEIEQLDQYLDTDDFKIHINHDTTTIMTIQVNSEELSSNADIEDLKIDNTTMMPNNLKNTETPINNEVYLGNKDNSESNDSSIDQAYDVIDNETEVEKVDILSSSRSKYSDESLNVETTNIPEYTKDTDDAIKSEIINLQEKNSSIEESETDAETTVQPKSSSEIIISAEMETTQTSITDESFPSDTIEDKKSNDLLSSESETDKIFENENYESKIVDANSQHFIVRLNNVNNENTDSSADQSNLNNDAEEDLEINPSDKQSILKNIPVQDLNTNSLENQSNSNNDEEEITEQENGNINDFNEAKKVTAPMTDVPNEGSNTDYPEIIQSNIKDTSIPEGEIYSAIIEPENDNAISLEIEAEDQEHITIASVERKLELNDETNNLKNDSIESKHILLAHDDIQSERIPKEINLNHTDINSALEEQDSVTDLMQERKKESGSQENFDAGSEDLTSKTITDIAQLNNHAIENNEEVVPSEPSIEIKDSSFTTISYSIAGEEIQELENDGWEVIDYDNLQVSSQPSEESSTGLKTTSINNNDNVDVNPITERINYEQYSSLEITNEPNTENLEVDSGEKSAEISDGSLLQTTNTPIITQSTVSDIQEKVTESVNAMNINNAGFDIISETVSDNVQESEDMLDTLPVQTFEDETLELDHMKNDENQQADEVEESLENSTLNIDEELKATNPSKSEEELDTSTISTEAEFFDETQSTSSYEETQTEIILEEMSTQNPVEIFEGTITVPNENHILKGESFVTPIVEINVSGITVEDSAESHQLSSAESTEMIKAASSIMETFASTTDRTLQTTLRNHKEINTDGWNEEDKEIVEELEMEILLDKMEEDILEEQIKLIDSTINPILSTQEEQSETDNIIHEIYESAELTTSQDNDYEEELQQVEQAIEEAAQDLTINQQFDDSKLNNDYEEELEQVEHAIEEAAHDLPYNKQFEITNTPTISSHENQVGNLTKLEDAKKILDEDENPPNKLIETLATTTSYISPLDIIVNNASKEIFTETVTTTTESYGVFNFFKNIYGIVSGSSTTNKPEFETIQTAEDVNVPVTFAVSIPEYITKSTPVEDLSSNVVSSAHTDINRDTTVLEFISEHTTKPTSVYNINIEGMSIYNNDDNVASTSTLITRHSGESESSYLENIDDTDTQQFELPTEIYQDTDNLENPEKTINFIKDTVTETIKVSEEGGLNYSEGSSEDSSLDDFDGDNEANISSVADSVTDSSISNTRLGENKSESDFIDNDKTTVNSPYSTSNDSLSENFQDIKSLNEEESTQETVLFTTENNEKISQNPDDYHSNQPGDGNEQVQVNEDEFDKIKDEVTSFEESGEMHNAFIKDALSESADNDDGDDEYDILPAENNEYDDEDETTDYISTDKNKGYTSTDTVNNDDDNNMISKLIDTFNIMSTNSVEDETDSTEAENDTENNDEFTSHDLDILHEDLEDLGSERKHFNEDVQEIEEILKTKKIFNANNSSLHRIVGSIYNDYGDVCLNLNLSARININNTLITVPPNAIVKGNCSNSEIHVKIGWKSVSDETVNNTIYFIMKVDGTHYYINYVHINLLDQRRKGMQEHEMLDLQALSSNGQAVNKSESIAFEDNITLELIDANMKVQEYFGSLGGSVTLAYGNAFILQIASGCICILAVLIVLGYYMYRKTRSKERIFKVDVEK